MPIKLPGAVILLAALILYCNINFAQTRFEGVTGDYIITKRLLTVENGLPGNLVFCAIQDKDGFMWFGTDKGLSRFDGISFTNFSKEKNGLSGNRISKLNLDDSGHLLIVAFDEMTSFTEVSLMNLKTETISKPKYPMDHANVKLPINWKTIESGNLKYFNNSIALYLKNERIDIFSKNELSNFPVLNFSGSYLDKYGNYWLCSHSGVFKISIKKNVFINYFNSTFRTEFLSKQVRNIYVESNSKDKLINSIYACMGNELIIQKGNTIEVVTNKDFIIYSMLKMPDKMYVGGSKLHIFDSKKLQFKEVAELNDKEIWALYPASSHDIYVGTSNGIFLYNDSTQKSEQLKFTDSNFPSSSIIYRFVQTQNHGLIAVAQNGLFQIKNTSIVDYFGSEALDVDHKLPMAEIYDMYEDKEGVCWIASNGKGLFRWTWAAIDKKGAFENFSLIAGLPSNILCRIEEDDRNNLWVSTYNGLFSFNKNSRLVNSFSTADGIINNEFNRASSFKGRDGRMFFGTINGLTAFYPSEVLKNAKIDSVPFQVTMIHKYSAAKNDFEPCINEFRRNDKIVLHSGEGLLTFELSLLDFQERPLVYRYIIEGLPGKWKLEEGKALTINSLPYGEFNLKIQAQLANGSWNPVDIEIPIIVLKPYYLEPWFINLCIIALAALATLYFTSKTNKLLRSKWMLESLVQSRTTSLSNALRDKDLLIKEVHHRVKNNLQVIISLLHLQNDKIPDENMKLAILESQSRIGSIALIHQNLYQNGQLDGIKFDEFVINLAKQLDDFYRRLHREILLETDIVNAYIDIDTAVPLGLILNELFSNTYKHAFKNTSNIKVTVSMQETSKGVYKLVFHDSGPGLAEELLFNNAQTLGLELIRGLAKQLHGKSSYKYNEGGEFTITFKDSITRKND